MRLAVVALAASFASTGLVAAPVFADSPAIKVVPTSCYATPKRPPFTPVQEPRIGYRAVAPLGYGTVTGTLHAVVTENGAAIRTATWSYLGQPLVVYRLSPLPAGRYTEIGRAHV